MLSNRNGLMALFAASLLVLTLASSSLAADSSTAGDRPDYQRNNSAQNIWENFTNWLDYSNDLDDEFLEAADAGETEYATELLGEQFSATTEFYIHMATSNIPKNACARDFWFLAEGISSDYALVYGAMYHNLTAEVGEPIEVDPLFDAAASTTSFYFENDLGVAPKCWNKLDT